MSDLMTNKGFEAKGQILRPHFDINCITFDLSSSKNYPEVFIRKDKHYNGRMLRKQKMFNKLPF